MAFSQENDGGIVKKALSNNPSVSFADSVSLRLGHARALRVHRTLIHSPRATSLPLHRGAFGTRTFSFYISFAFCSSAKPLWNHPLSGVFYYKKECRHTCDSTRFATETRYLRGKRESGEHISAHRRVLVCKRVCACYARRRLFIYFASFCFFYPSSLRSGRR